MAVIWKYQVPWKNEVPIEQSFTLKIPSGSQVLCVQTQNDFPHVWAMVYSPNAPIEVRKFVVCNTGSDIPDSCSLAYIGTFQTARGMFVFHLFEDIT